jgi:hypothetical protein
LVLFTYSYSDQIKRRHTGVTCIRNIRKVHKLAIGILQRNTLLCLLDIFTANLLFIMAPNTSATNLLRQNLTIYISLKFDTMQLPGMGDTEAFPQ